jgi:hypothetical protein
MALVIEDGSGISNANSYGSIAGARSYALDRGITLSSDDAVVTGQLVNATDYLEGLRYVGLRKTNAQALSWPRTCVVYEDGTPFPTNLIPPNLINAQYQAVIDQANGIELEPSTSQVGGFVTYDKVDVLVTKYSEVVGTSQQPNLPKVINLLEGLLIVQPVLRTVRL